MKSLSRIVFMFLVVALSACGGGSTPPPPPSPPITTYAIGGSVSGLTGALVLQNNLSDQVSIIADGNFTFSTKLADAANYDISVLTQPAGQACTITNGNGAVNGADVSSVTVSCVNVPSYNIGGNVSGLAGTVILQNNGGDNLSISADGGFTFSTAVNENGNYNVSVLTQPVGQSCVVSDGSGVVSADVNSVSLACSNVPTYSIGGDVSGLLGTVVLQNNTGENLSISADGSFTFSTVVNEDGNYSISVLTQPVGQTCSVSNAVRMVVVSNVTDVLVTCSDVTYTIGGTVSGLVGTLVLQNNGADDLSTYTNGNFSFSTSIESGASYNVDVESQPANYSCAVSNGSGEVSNENVTTVNVVCSSRSVALSNLGITTNSPSVVVMPIHVSDKNSGLSVSGLTTNDFSVLEDGAAVGVESFVSSKPVGDVNYTFRTVVVMDISSSILAVDFTAAKTALQSYVSNLQANQEIAIYTFDDTVTLVQNFTSDQTVLTTAIGNIARGSASTNLYGAISTSAGNMNDVFNLNGVVYNSMVVITDGDDTSGLVSKATATSAVQNKKAYALPVGSAAVAGSPLYLSLVDIFGEDQILLSTDFSVLSSTLDTVRNNLIEYFKGLYYVYYASPSRSGSHTIDLSVVGNTNAATDNAITGTFSASGFSSVTPTVEIVGESSIVGSSIVWNASTLWSNDPPNYIWKILDTTGVETDASSVMTSAVTADSSGITLVKVGDLENQYIIEVTDLNWNLTTTKNIDVIVDTDVDGTRNSLDTDDDGDGVLDVNDPFPLDATETLDTDGDGIGNNTDTDDDGDGVLDVNDPFPLDATETLDTDGDGIGNNTDTDDDGDGVLDVNDAFPLDATETLDTDGDGIGNNTDADDDGDGVLDVNDALPLDATETLDTDGDGIGNNTDADDDGDGVLDVNDAFPLDATETLDTDGDGIGNNTDADDDGDGVLDVKDFKPLDPAKFKRDIISLSDLSGSNGFVLNGVDAGDNSGVSVSAAGDINGDGLGDLIIGANAASPNGQGGGGESYVVFGTNAGWSASMNLSALDGSNGFVLNGIDAGDNSGYSVSAAGDINGDGLDDLIIGANQADHNGLTDAGESYVVYGSNAAWPASMNLSTLDGSNGFVLNGIDGGDNSGFSVSAVGDINGDGLGDLIIGAKSAGLGLYSGESYIVFGNSGLLTATRSLNLSGSNGFVLQGIDSGDNSGYSVSAAGDINGDGLDDLIIGTHGADPNGQAGAGESYVVFGSNAAWPASMPLSALDGSNGFVLFGIDSSDYSGVSVSAAGDINGDGLDDLIIGAYLADPNGRTGAGESYVVFGSNAAWPASMNLSTLNGSNGFVLNGIDANDNSGRRVSAAGDINGDGLDDLIIGAYLADPNSRNGAGESYVVFGSSAAWPASMSLSTLDGINGFVLNGIDVGDNSGVSVSAAGDINGDGLDDIIIGANLGDPNAQSDAGESYVIFGCNYTDLNYCKK